MEGRTGVWAGDEPTATGTRAGRISRVGCHHGRPCGPGRAVRWLRRGLLATLGGLFLVGVAAASLAAVDDGPASVLGEEPEARAAALRTVGTPRNSASATSSARAWADAVARAPLTSRSASGSSKTPDGAASGPRGRSLGARSR